jgi:8-oxo-dGTP diphosphatase
MIASAHPNAPISTVDAVVFTLEDDMLKILLHKRDKEPCEGLWALPGGFIHTDKDTCAEAAMRRVLSDKTGVSGFYLEQLATYTGPARDPRGWSLSITHIALVPREELKIGPGHQAALFPVDKLPDLAFDHNLIVAEATARLQGKGAYSTLPVSFLGTSFTLSEMQRSYEVVLGAKLNQSSFRRKVLSLDIIKDTGKTSQEGNARPAKLYKLKSGVNTFDRTLGQALA